MVKSIFLAAILALFSTLAIAAPQTYDIDYPASKIEFTYDFNNEPVKGKFPKFSADLLLDFQDIRKSKISVSIDTRSALGGFVFATSALRGAKILNAKKFPQIQFQSQSAQLKNGVAQIKGLVTVRGVTRPLVLTARFFQLQGNAPEDRDELTITISGTINRHDFGASGYRDLVGETLAINIKARIKRRP